MTTKQELRKVQQALKTLSDVGNEDIQSDFDSIMASVYGGLLLAEEILEGELK